MPRFAHMSDIHIGAFRQQPLRDLVNEAFDRAVDRCVSEKVDFVVLSGDVFDSNIPDLSSVRRAARKLREAGELGLRFYIVYGSHDFSPNFASIVDVLEGAGLFVRADGGATPEALGFAVDPSGAKICGLSGKKLSLDRSDYKSLDRERLEMEDGFKIFVFHGAIDEMKPEGLDQMEAMPVSALPSGFGYYAGGHVHTRRVESFPGRENVAFPGPLFATDYSELVAMAHGTERGFYIVDFDSKVRSVEFVPVKTCKVVEYTCTAEGKSPAQVREEVSTFGEGADLEGAVALLTVSGVLGEGRTSDIDFASVRERLASRGPLLVLSNLSRLTSREQAEQVPPPRPLGVTEREVLEQRILSAKPGEARLAGGAGVETALSLLGALKEDKRENENRAEYRARMEDLGLSVLGLELRD
jgi:DNA repair protein SbcD/Mre11